jgi:hypothetical protein
LKGLTLVVLVAKFGERDALVQFELLRLDTIRNEKKED